MAIMAYTPIYKPNQLILGHPDSQLVVVTGWTPKEYVAKHLNPDTYAAIGQLYSPTRGINFLVRNLLANPGIRWLVSLGVTKEDTNAGGVQCLADFFTHGVTSGLSDTGRPCWVINSKVVGYIDLEIPLADLNDLRDRIAHYDGGSTRQEIKEIMSDTARLVASLAEWGYVEPVDPPKTYPMTMPRSNTKPASPVGHRIEGDTIAECWVKILHRIRLNGHIRPTGYDGQVQELINLITVVESEPESLYFPEPNYLPFDRAFIEDGYLDSMLGDAEYGEGVKYTYGQRLRSWFGTDLVGEAVAKLRADRDSSRVLINLWDSRVDGNINFSYPPCLYSIWFRVVDNRLTLTATLRSNDMYRAWVANAMALRVLQERIRLEVDPDLELGELITISQSAHLYDDTWEAAESIVKAHHSKVPEYHDKVGYFIVEFLAGNWVRVTQHSTKGEEVGRFDGTKPLHLLRRVIASNPSIMPDHAAYLGLEVSKAFDKGAEYTQDR